MMKWMSLIWDIQTSVGGGDSAVSCTPVRHDPSLFIIIRTRNNYKKKQKGKRNNKINKRKEKKRKKDILGSPCRSWGQRESEVVHRPRWHWFCCMSTSLLLLLHQRLLGIEGLLFVIRELLKKKRRRQKEKKRLTVELPVGTLVNLNAHSETLEPAIIPSINEKEWKRREEKTEERRKLGEVRKKNENKRREGEKEEVLLVVVNVVLSSGDNALGLNAHHTWYHQSWCEIRILSKHLKNSSSHWHSCNVFFTIN